MALYQDMLEMRELPTLAEAGPAMLQAPAPAPDGATGTVAADQARTTVLAAKG